MSVPAVAIALLLAVVMGSVSAQAAETSLWLIAGKGALLDGMPAQPGDLPGAGKVQSGGAEARILARSGGQAALLVLAPHCEIAIEGPSADGKWRIEPLGGAIKIVGTGVLEVTSAGKPVEQPSEIWILEVASGLAGTIESSGEKALELFPKSAPAALESLGPPSKLLPAPVIKKAEKKKKGGGSDGGSGDGAETSGESKCIDSTSGPDGSGPTTDGIDPVELDRTKSRVIIRIGW